MMFRHMPRTARRHPWASAALALTSVTAALAQPVAPVVVPATANIFYAGVNATPPTAVCSTLGPTGAGDGTLPIRIDIPAGTTWVTLDTLPNDPAYRGSVQYMHYPDQLRNTPDGDNRGGTNIQQAGDACMPEAASNGLSGIYHSRRYAFLVGWA